MSDFQIVGLFFGTLMGLVVAPGVLIWIVEKKEKWIGQKKTD